VHISELAQHHVENPREIVSQGDQVNVRILEVDADRRRLSLSLKRVEDGMPVQPKPGEEAEPPALGLSDEVFADEVPAAEALEPAVADEAETPAEAEPSPRRAGLRGRAGRRGAEPGREAESRGAGRRGDRPPRAGAEARQSRSRRLRRGTGRIAMQRPLAVALTGGIAAGKSEALQAFARHGAA
jgi:small subunit ribosomal protein S1